VDAGGCVIEGRQTDVVIGHRNDALKRIGVSKLRLMAGRSRDCVVCGQRVDRRENFPRNHLCAEHSDWELIVVDGPNDEAERQASIDRLLGR
jgi:hypothetical protein